MVLHASTKVQLEVISQSFVLNIKKINRNPISRNVLTEHALLTLLSLKLLLLNRTGPLLSGEKDPIVHETLLSLLERGSINSPAEVCNFLSFFSFFSTTDTYTAHAKQAFSSSLHSSPSYQPICQRQDPLAGLSFFFVPYSQLFPTTSLRFSPPY